MIRRQVLVGIGLALLGGCATNGAVRKVETQILVLRTEAARRDSARAADLAAVIEGQSRVIDSLIVLRESIRQVKGDLSGDLFNIQQQLLQVQELTGQSQRRLSEIRRELQAREQNLQVDTTGAILPDSLGVIPLPPSADEMYQTALTLLRRGSVGTARLGFQEFLRTYPTEERVPAALLNLGETFAGENPDSAAYYFREVATRYDQSDRAPTAWYKLGQLAELEQDLTAARDAYQEVVRRFPRSPEANLARDRLTALRP